MGSAGFVQPPLRGFVPYGELDPRFDLLRLPIVAQVPFWEGAGLPKLYSRLITGAGFGGLPFFPSDAYFIDPIVTNGASLFPPRWNLARYDPALGIGAFVGGHSGHAGIGIFGQNSVAAGAGYRWDSILDPTISSPFIVGNNFSLLLVGTPQQDAGQVTAPTTMIRSLCAAGTSSTLFHQWKLIYATGKFIWTEFAVSGSGTPLVPNVYGERIALLWVHGAEENNATPRPRLFIGRENGEVTRVDFPTLPNNVSFLSDRLWLGVNDTNTKLNAVGGGLWENLVLFARNFTADEARLILRDAMGIYKQDDHPVRRVPSAAFDHCIAGSPGTFARVGSAPAARVRVGSSPAARATVGAAPPMARTRVGADANATRRVSAVVKICGKEVDVVVAKPICPSELGWNADNVFELDKVLDELAGTPGTPITVATNVSVAIFDLGTGLEISGSPVALAQVGGTNHWRQTVLVNAGAGFTQDQRLRLEFTFDGGTGLRGFFEALAVVATSIS